MGNLKLFPKSILNVLEIQTFDEICCNIIHPLVYNRTQRRTEDLMWFVRDYWVDQIDLIKEEIACVV